MSALIDQLNTIKIENIQKPEFLEDSDLRSFEIAKLKLGEAYKYLSRAASVESVSQIPTEFKSRLSELITNYYEQAKSLNSITGGTISELTQKFNGAINRITVFHNDVFQISSSNYALPLLNSIICYGNEFTAGIVLLFCLSNRIT